MNHKWCISMNSNATRRLITKVILALVVMIACILALMATRAGLIELSPRNIFMGMFVLIVGGALLNMLQVFISNDSLSKQRDAMAAEPEGRK